MQGSHQGARMAPHSIVLCLFTYKYTQRAPMQSLRREHFIWGSGHIRPREVTFVITRQPEMALFECLASCSSCSRMVYNPSGFSRRRASPVPLCQKEQVPCVILTASCLHVRSLCVLASKHNIVRSNLHAPLRKLHVLNHWQPQTRILARTHAVSNAQ